MSTRLKTPTASSGHKPTILILLYNFHGKLKAFFNPKSSKWISDRHSHLPNTSHFLTDSLHFSNTSFQFAKREQNPRKSIIIMPEIFGKRKMKETILPQGFHGEIPPDENLKCDLPGCKVESDEWSILELCWYSFRTKCLEGLSHCSLCNKSIGTKIEELGKVAKQAIFNSKSCGSIHQEVEAEDDNDIDDDDDEVGDHNCCSNDIPNIDSQYIEKAITSLNNRIHQHQIALHLTILQLIMKHLPVNTCRNLIVNNQLGNMQLYWDIITLESSNGSYHITSLSRKSLASFLEAMPAASYLF